MKDKIWLLALLFIPFVFILIVGIGYLQKETKPLETYSKSGEIKEFYNKRIGTNKQKRMFIVIDDETYYITTGLRWALDDDILIETLAPLNNVEIEYIVNGDIKSVVAIKESNKSIVTYEETLIGQKEYTNVVSHIAFYAAYLYLLFVVIVMFRMSDKYLLDTTYGFNNKSYLSYLQIIFNIIISICLFSVSFLIIVINKWLYFPLITLAMGYILWSLNSVNKILYGKNGFRVFQYTKCKHYGWNAVKEIVKINKKLIIINFKEAYNLNNPKVSSYKKVAKLNNNKYWYKLRIKNASIKEFDELYQKYYLKNKK